MKTSKAVFVAAALVPLLAAMGGCASSLIGHRPGADRVSMADASQVSGCQSKGAITVSVMSKIVFFQRSADDVEANLYQLARNDAVDYGADTVVKGDAPTFGERAFALYKCRP